MFSVVAEAARQALKSETDRMSPGRRMELALMLGDQSIELYVAMHGIREDEAHRILRSRNVEGRVYSRCIQESLE